MAVVNFPIEHEPRGWEDIKNQDVIVRQIRRMIQTERWAPSLFFCGSSGVGKTATVRLMIRAAHCLNRQPGEDQPCGHCSVCRSDPMESSSLNNVVWVKASSRESSESDKLVSYESQIKEAFTYAERGPIKSKESHRDVLFVVFDECHLMPDSLRQRALAFADVMKPINGDVVLVFITMQQERIQKTPYLAMTSRGRYLKFNTPTEIQIQEYLTQTFPQCPFESAQIIARAANRSYRSAVQIYRTCVEEDAYVSPKMVTDLLRITDKSHRDALWLKIIHKEPLAEIKRYFEELTLATEPSLLMQQMYEDVLDNLEQFEREQTLSLGRIFHEYFKDPTLYNAIYVLFELSEQF
ncbi:hypothetical protein ACQ4M3_09315 [Leptolyngbya sp. AN03gr2]|uniref:hypothetical protein n=1 Tax=Leptolyngbya sp. AN03gr2 TaxID=3423364 RepID=UPI003D31ECC7